MHEGNPLQVNSRARRPINLFATLKRLRGLLHLIG